MPYLRQGKPVLITLAVLATAALVLLAAWWRNASASDRWDAIGEAGREALVVVVIGTVVTYALHAAQEQRHEAQMLAESRQEWVRRRTEYLMELLRRLRTAYGDVKRARRHLQAAGFRKALADPIGDRVAEIYFVNMETLTGARLELEAIVDELKAGMEDDEGPAQIIATELDAMADYLKDGVLEEYYERGKALRRNPASLTYKDFRAACSLAQKSKASFEANLGQRYDLALETLIRSIHNPPLDESTRPAAADAWSHIWEQRFLSRARLVTQRAVVWRQAATDRVKAWLPSTHGG